MDREQELRRAISRGVEASAFRESQPYANAFSTVAENLITGLMQTSPEQGEKRESIYQLYQSLLAIDSQLQNVIDDGDLARSELDE